MAAVVEALKSLRAWQIGTLAALLAATAAGTFGVYAVLNGSDEAELGEDQHLIPVRAGNLVNEVSVNGSLVFPTREALTFGSQGLVKDVLVEEGQGVEAGQPLATLDDETVARLDKAVAQARVSLEDAEDDLALSLDPHTALDMAKAEAAVADARLALRDAQDALDDLLTPSQVDIANAEAALVASQLALEAAQEALDSALTGPDADALALTFAGLDAASTGLSNAQRDLKLADSQWSASVEVAQDTFDDALEAYEAIFLRWLGITITSAESEIGPTDLLAQWQIDLTALFAPSQRYNDLGQYTFTDGFPADDPATKWDESKVYSWLNFYPGGILATCEDGLVPPQSACVGLEIDTAWDALSTASVALEDGQTKQATASAKAALAVSRAEQDLADARDTVDELTAGADSLELSRLEKQLGVAQATLDDAGEALATLTGTVDPLELGAAGDRVALAEAGLTEEQVDLTELRGGPDPLQVTLRRAEAEAARTALSAAIERFERSTLTAPWDGVVSLVGVEVGQAVNAGTTIVEIVDPAVVELDGIVDEIDVLFIRNGASATISMDALPGETLRGSVSAVASAAQSQQGVVSYPIRIRIAAPDSVQLPEGLSAVASVVIREDNDVLLVPLQSLRGSFDQPAVQVMFNGRLEERAVTLGNSDDFWIVVESGLSEGDMVVVEAQSASTTGSFGFGGREFRRFSGQFGGGGAGGGFGGGRGFVVGDHN